MSSRFHNKYHRHNHHTQSVNDPNYPDASHDPIASPDSPFLGPFVLTGSLSASSITENSPAPGIFVAENVIDVAIDATGSIRATGVAEVSSIAFTGDVLNTYQSPLIANGEFLQIRVNGVVRYIRLWNNF